MARRYPSSSYDSRYSRGYMSVNTSSYLAGDRREGVSYRDRWLGSKGDQDSYRHRSSSPERYRNAGTGGPGPGAGSGYRSRSWENSTSSSPRDRLAASRESYTNAMNSSSRSYMPGRSYGRSISFGKDSYLSPVTAPRKTESYTGGILKHTSSSSAEQAPVSILSRGGAGDSGSGRRQRHNTLTFGVSGEDLDRARSNIQKYTRRLSDDTRPVLHTEPQPLTKKAASRYSLPDVFDSLSGSNYFEGRHSLTDNIMQSRAILSNSNISSYSPYTQARPLEQSMSGVGVLGQGLRGSASAATGCHLPPSRHTSPLMSSSLPSGIDISSLHGYSGSPGGGGGAGYHAATGSERTPGSANNDQTLKSLQKHYMNAITSLNPSLPTQGSNEKVVATEEDSEAKKPTELIDDILKLWEESQSENRRLRLENNALKLELQTTKTQLELAVQASAQNSESDNQKEEKLVMEKKIMDLEDQLRQNNMSSLKSDQTITQLKDETSRLREENAGLIKAISKLSN